MKQNALLVGVNLKNQKDFANSMEELFNLADSCDIDVVGKVTQKLNRVNKSHYLGKGKVTELLILLHEKNTNMVIFNDELSPSQVRNLEATLKCRVIDRTILILDIFALRAKTREAQLQVEVTKLQYMLPRLIGFGESSGQKGSGESNKNSGSGETKQELNRRKIENRVIGLNQELETLVSQRQNQRKKRKKMEIPVIALVGYTNAGKSSIMNAMMNLFNGSIDKQVFEKDMLFATLETSVRSIKFPDNKSFLLTDTVGFISKLPHQLVKAFRSTLEEVSEADLLIHVVDYSNPYYKQQVEVTTDTLKELGVNNIPVIYAYNKTDLIDNEDSKEEEKEDVCVYISAKEKVGIDKLVNAIYQKVFTKYINCDMLIPYGKENIISYLHDNANVKSTIYEGNGILISMQCKRVDYERYKKYAN
ncbi:GTPase HflX [Clostridium tagluense]|uniref:GTPase HflX n=1 Tax=Clostridium tagluense TaxID=360422 RepID=UPI001C0B0DF8|nr:GTPase HflX [Clostridium tagluense]MBU3130747.1 GTPase HflX [Clostridium tagluense]